MVTAYEKAIKSLWIGRCTVYTITHQINEVNKRSEAVEVISLQDEPCRLSFKTITATEPDTESAIVRQVVKLIISKTAEIPPGSKIVVTQNGKTGTYTRSGDPAIYTHHQEIVLEKAKERA